MFVTVRIHRRVRTPSTRKIFTNRITIAQYPAYSCLSMLRYKVAVQTNIVAVEVFYTPNKGWRWSKE